MVNVLAPRLGNLVIQQGSKIKIIQIFLYSIFYSKKPKNTGQIILLMSLIFLENYY